MSTACAHSAEVKVSVAMITYNHERFIADAIESVLMQQTQFAVELVIGEDCSTDGTRAIVTEYAGRYPERIRPLLHEHNLGLQGKHNYVEALNACRGQYVAILEGDDYWTDPLKLQCQVDFLDSHSDYTLCFHNVAKVDAAGESATVLYCPPDQKAVLTLADLLHDNPVPACSVMYRRAALHDLPTWFYSVPMSDWPMHVLVAEHGRVRYINAAMAAYRLHVGGLWTGQDGLARALSTLRTYDCLDGHFGRKYTEIIQAGKRQCIENAACRIAASPRVDSGARSVVSDIECLFAQEPSTGNDEWRRSGKARAYAALTFTSHRSLDFEGVRRSVLHVLRNDPSYLARPGLASVALEGFLGSRAACGLRRVARSLRTRVPAEIPNRDLSGG